MAWTAPRTWVTSEVVTAAMMNTHVRDNLLSIHDYGMGSVFTVGDIIYQSVSYLSSDAEVFRAFMPMKELNAQGLTTSLRLIGARYAVNQGGGGQATFFSAGSANNGFVGSSPTMTTLTGWASDAATNWTWHDTGWLTIGAPIVLTNDILRVHVGLDANNTGQTTYIMGTVYARLT